MASYTKPLSPSETMQLFLTSGGVDTSAFVVKSGGRGELAGYETATRVVEVADSPTLTINQDSPDSLWGTFANKITIEQGVAGTSWVKLYCLKKQPFVSVTLGANWYWAGGEVPTFSGGGLLVMAWNGLTGIVNYIYDGLDTQGGTND